MKTKKSISKKEYFLSFDNKTLSYFFLGIGVLLFVLNISTMLSFMPENYSYYAFDISIFSAILIIVYTTYEITR